ncbi:MAG: DNA alkylation repair protein [Candidatus Pacebacteria bacterium]|jgi:3-methyladenine DNA glycosylase AlkD|nr:DNA alkylation repair protein [Candidatus Paceibacterota bacterium]
MTSLSVIKALNKLKSKERAVVSARYFKTGIGQYGEGDIFIGVTVPDQRKIAKKFKALPFNEIEVLLKSKIHEHRLTALLILGSKKIDKEVYDFYMNHLPYVNNWDLVDSSAHIIGEYLFDRDRMILELLSSSDKIWERRIAIIATHYFIRKKDFSTTFVISEKLLGDYHDLIHKAVGWSLREVGKKDKQALVDFLTRFSKNMPRTALRYAIEHFSDAERKSIMAR